MTNYQFLFLPQRQLTCNIILSLLLLLSLLFISGCAQPGVKQPSRDASELSEIQQLADEAYLKDDLQNAAKLYEQLVTEMPEVALNWYRLANLYTRLNRPYTAINFYQEAIARDPALSEAWFNLSIVQLKQAAFSLNQMLETIDKNDPLYAEAERLLDEIKSMMSE